jgi:nitrate/nitrite transporter NarK
VTYRLKGSPNQGLLAATPGFFVGFTAVALFGPTAKKFKDVLDLSPTSVGLLVAVPSLSAAYGVLSLGSAPRFHISNPDRNSGTGDDSQVPGAGFFGGELP